MKHMPENVAEEQDVINSMHATSATLLNELPDEVRRYLLLPDKKTGQAAQPLKRIGDAFFGAAKLKPIEVQVELIRVCGELVAIISSLLLPVMWSFLPEPVKANEPSDGMLQRDWTDSVSALDIRHAVVMAIIFHLFVALLGSWTACFFAVVWGGNGRASEAALDPLYATLGFAFFTFALPVFFWIPALFCWDMIIAGHPIVGLTMATLCFMLSFRPLIWTFLHRIQMAIPLCFVHMPTWLHVVGTLQCMPCHAKVLFGDSKFRKAAEEQAAQLQAYAEKVLSESST